MVEIKTDAAMDAMREAGRVVARALAAVREAAGVGVSLQELDEAARSVLAEAGAGSRSSDTGRPSPRSLSRP